MHHVFIDGQAGTTGLQIAERLERRGDLRLVEISHEDRKNAARKREIMNEVDLVILCLPDGAARESVQMIHGDQVRVLDASTAHRTRTDWVYGLPELNPGRRESICSATQVANPGCYPTGFLLGIVPLVQSGIVPETYPVFVDAVSGYSGGGRQLIETYEAHREKNSGDPWTYRKYGLQLSHKHIPEMRYYSGLSHDPMFVPAVADFRQGMLVSVPLTLRLLKSGTSAAAIQECLAGYYDGETFVRVYPLNDMAELDNGFLSPLACNETNRVDIMVFANDTQALIVSRLDNLGKGAAGAAVQNLNLMLGETEQTGLTN